MRGVAGERRRHERMKNCSGEIEDPLEAPVICFQYMHFGRCRWKDNGLHDIFHNAPIGMAEGVNGLFGVPDNEQTSLL